MATVENCFDAEHTPTEPVRMKTARRRGRMPPVVVLVTRRKGKAERWQARACRDIGIRREKTT
jgi:hypothetical protein